LPDSAAASQLALKPGPELGSGGGRKISVSLGETIAQAAQFPYNAAFEK